VATFVDHGVELYGIGASLREARVRRGLSLADVERVTCIRAANLEALEDERYNALPGDVYALGFVRTYAAFLGLDADRYAELFRDERLVPEEPIVPEPLRPARDGRRTWIVAAAVALAIAALAAAVVLRPHHAAPRKPAAPAGPVLGTSLVLRAGSGPSWVTVRIGGEHGNQVWQGTLRRGRQLRFGLATQLWLGLGTPPNLTARIGTTPVRLGTAERYLADEHGVVRASRK
jgi:transcriptional regulator with XRE-family HTH domain